MLQSQYVSTLRNLIQAPTSPVPLVPDSLLKVYINLARAQAAIDAECIRMSGGAVATAGLTVIPIAQIDLLPFGVSQAIVVRNALLNGQRVDIRPWDWFANYYLAGPPQSVTPAPVMAHQGQGTFSTLYLSSRFGGNLAIDLVLLPDDLVDDFTPDLLPYPWTEAVPFYGAWYAYMTMQRQADAQTMLGRYHEVMRRGRTEVTSTTLPENDPGGVGAAIANSKVSLGQPPAPPPRQGRGAAG